MSLARQDRLVWCCVVAAFLAGLLVRLWPVLAADFPLNDGGMFYVMAQEIRTAHYHLPFYTSYNFSHIPFTYPPLGFYAAALLADVTGASLLDILRFFPASLSALTTLAYYGFSQAVLGSRRQAIMGCFAFTLLPRTYGWMVMGGGLTRAPGFAFAILALHQVYRLYTRHDRRYILTAAVLASLTALTHAEMAWFVVYSVGLLWLFHGRTVATLADSVLLALAATILTCPWWLTVVSRHGLAPFQAAAHTGSQRWFTWHPSYVTGEPFWPILGFIGLAGLVACCINRRFYLPVWVVTIFIVQPRSARTLAMVPLTMAMGLALDRVILPALHRWSQSKVTVPTAAAAVAASEVVVAARETVVAAREPEPEGISSPPPWLGPLPVAFLTCLFLYACLAAWLTDVTAPPLQALGQPERATMRWVAAATPPSSRFLILTADGLWDDRTLEWFPALAQRTSVTTIQGSEWLPAHRFYRLWQQADKLAACGAGVKPDAMPARPQPGRIQSVPCVRQWARQWGVAWTHIYIRKEPKPGPGRDYWKPVAQFLRSAPYYRVVYDGAGATIFAAREPGHQSL